MTYSSWPLLSTRSQIDTSYAAYVSHGYYTVTDSVYDKGQLTMVEIWSYDNSGKYWHGEKFDIANPAKREHVMYEFNSAGKCVLFKKCQTEHADTSYLLERRLITTDTAKHTFVYEDWHRFMNGKADTILGSIEMKAIDTKGKNRWSQLYTNHYIFSISINKDSSAWRTAMIGMHDSDTLYRCFVGYAYNQYPTDSTIAYLWDNSVAQTIVVNMRILETKTWENNNLIEFHTYKDSIVDWRIVRTNIYNELSGSTDPEVVITYSDTLNKVTKNGVVIYEDHQPEITWYPPPPPPPPPTPHGYGSSLNQIYPFIKTFKLADGSTKFECYDFRSGSLKPLLIVTIDSMGFTRSFQEGNLLHKLSWK